MSQNKILPTWAQLRREIELEVERLEQVGRAHRSWADRRRRQLASLPAEDILAADRASRARTARVREELVAALTALNATVGQFNARVPVVSLQLMPFRIERFLDG